MSDDKIEQNVTVSGNAQTGDITLIGKIVQVYNIIKHPALWQDALWYFITQNWPFILIWFLLEILIATLYTDFKNLYVIPLGRALFVEFLFTIAYWSTYSCFKYQYTKWSTSTAAVAVLAFSGLVSWQAWQIVFPARFEPQAFGIAVAELGEGGNLQSTNRTREINNQVYEHLCSTIQNEFNATDNIDPCKNSNSFSKGNIQIKRIGVIPDVETAERYGNRIHSDVVIWGQILRYSSQGATIRFQVLETFDRAVDPDFPIVLPVKTPYTEMIIKELDLNSDPRELKDVISEESALISFFILGLNAYLDRDFQQAFTYFDQAVVSADNSSLVVSSRDKSLLYFYLGRSNHAIGRFAEGQEWLKRAQKADPDEPAIAMGLAIGYGGQGLETERETQLHAALDLINTWLETQPNDDVAIYDRGLIYQMLKQYEQASFDYQSIIDRDPNYYIVYITLGQVQSELGKYKLAEDSFNRAIELADKSGANPAWAYLNLALTYEKAGDENFARSSFQQAIRHAPQMDTMYFFYAKFLDDQNEVDAALHSYRQLLNVTKDKAWGYGVLGDYFRQHGLLNEASESYEKAVHYRPKDSLFHSYLAKVYFDLGDMPNAKREFENAISLEAGYYSFASYGGVLFQLGEFRRAAQMYEESLKRRPVDYAVLLNLGRTYEILGEPQKSIQIYRQVISMRNQFPNEIINEAEYRLKAIDIEGLP